MAREIEGRHHEADDIEGDDGQDNQVVIEKLWRLEEWFASRKFRSYEAWEFANVWKRGIFWFDWIHQHNEDSERYWDSLSEEKIHQETFQAGLRVPKIKI